MRKTRQREVLRVLVSDGSLALYLSSVSHIYRAVVSMIYFTFLSMPSLCIVVLGAGDSVTIAEPGSGSGASDSLYNTELMAELDDANKRVRQSNHNVLHA